MMSRRFTQRASVELEAAHLDVTSSRSGSNLLYLTEAEGMHRQALIAALAGYCLSLMLTASVLAQEVNLSEPRQKITTVSAVRARTGPQTAAQEITRLKLGTVVSAVARSADQSEIG